MEGDINQACILDEQYDAQYSYSAFHLTNDCVDSWPTFTFILPTMYTPTP